MNRARVLPAVVSIAMIAAVLEPLVRRPYDDGFPLSTYPMFASKRPTVMTLNYALGEGPAHERITLAPRFVGTREVLQAMRIFDRARQRGRKQMLMLCEAIAARVAQETEGPWATVTTIRMMTGTHDALDYLGAGKIGNELERLRCPVIRGGGGA
jgi:hypothetical protein